MVFCAWMTTNFWLKIGELSNIISDGISFLQNFRGMCTLSPMDIYRSGIPMSPKESRIYKLYSSCTQLPRVTSTSFLWSRSLCVFEGHKGGVTTVAFAPDGRKIVSGSSDRTVRLWDAEKGEAIGSALEGHRDGVTSIVFSPDGKKVASGSSDGTVWLWDAEKGAAIGSALEGYRGEVTSIVFSPDGKEVASGSSGSDVRLCDAEKGCSAVRHGYHGTLFVFFSSFCFLFSCLHFIVGQ
jgi:WD40 repeat protein